MFDGRQAYQLTDPRRIFGVTIRDVEIFQGREWEFGDFFEYLGGVFIWMDSQLVDVSNEMLGCLQGLLESRP